MYVPNTKQLCVLSHQAHPMLSLKQLPHVLRLFETKIQQLQIFFILSLTEFEYDVPHWLCYLYNVINNHPSDKFLFVRIENSFVLAYMEQFFSFMQKKYPENAEDV